ncbi:MAG TPA: hypoxanthine phosphoribosyltransferase [Acidimicrobiales bacterium]|nr:hypoxanthine phosphoribosyltransferase [Acidimicrobiales bacterium]
MIRPGGSLGPNRPTNPPAPPSLDPLDLLPRCAFPAAGAPLTCAVSGGPDSLALLVLAVAAGCRVTAVHVDHGLRPASAAEADVVAEVAARFGAMFRRERVVVPDGPNLEARARAARFAVLPPSVATGHTMDDQAETVLLNLLRGAGLDGAGAMQPGPEHPLLGLRRTETTGLCEAVGLTPVADPSNDDRRHLRNRVRHELLPLLADLGRRDPVPLLARHAAVAREDTTLLDVLAAEAVPDPADAVALSAAPRPLARRAVRRWLRSSTATASTGGRAGTDRHPPSLAEVERVLAVAAGRAVGTELAGGIRVHRTAQRLVIDPPSAMAGAGMGAAGAPSGKVTPVATEEAGTAVPAWSTPDVGPVLVSAAQIAARVAELGARITADFADDPPLLVGVLKGAMLFMSDLCRAIELPVDVDFMAVSSYGSATSTSGVVRIVKDLDAELTGRRVLVVEDIIDSGLTLNYLRKYLQARQPATVDVCALLVKDGEQRVELDLRYVGFTIPSEFVVGYGLDVAERYRNLAGVHRYLGDR